MIESAEENRSQGQISPITQTFPGEKVAEKVAEARFSRLFPAEPWPGRVDSDPFQGHAEEAGQPGAGQLQVGQGHGLADAGEGHVAAALHLQGQAAAGI